MGLQSEVVVASIEDVVKALLDYLVEPLLPLKSTTSSKLPSISEHQSVAKQVHAVVLLYNYYHRKRHPELEFLGFESFCKLILALKPTIMAYMKLINQSDSTKLDDTESRLSVTQIAIMDACNISLALDASKEYPDTEGWTVSKVAVLLIDSKKENCLLLFGSVTNGVWSVLEKDLDSPKNDPEKPVDRNIYKRKRVGRKPLRDKQEAEQPGLHKLALVAVKEATGITEADLIILESDLAYCLSNEKATSLFYIMQCTQSHEDLKVPIKETVESLQGPLVGKSSCSWTVTPVVEYYHVLPYAGICSDWMNREGFSNNLMDLSVGVDNVDVYSFQRKENSFHDEVIQSIDVSLDCLPSSCVEMDSNIDTNQITNDSCEKKVNENKDASDRCDNIADSIGNVGGIVNTCQMLENYCDIIQNLKKSDSDCGIANSFDKERGANMDEKDNGRHITCFSSHSSRPQNMDLDNMTTAFPQDEDKSKNAHAVVKAFRHLRRKTSSVEHDKEVMIGPINVKKEVSCSLAKSGSIAYRGAKDDTMNKISSSPSSDQDGMVVGDPALVPSQMNTKYVEKLHSVLASKENELTQTALRALLRKREKLSRQLRNVEDEIALCTKRIHAILDGGENDLGVKLEAIIDCCNDVCLKGDAQIGHGTYQHIKYEGSTEYMTGKKISEAVISLKSSCQDLDDICHKNNWVLPIYHVVPSDAGFLADVTVKGMDFEFSEGSVLLASPRKARESAAACMIAKLRSVAETLNGAR